MHIPDGYLSPSTCAVLYAGCAPFWYVASQRIRRAVSARLVPLISVFAAFSFVIMMFNIPLPGGTSGHAVGAALVAIVLGPWAAILAISVALAIQALFFGDGGILAFGANAFNMAVAMPLVASFVYRMVTAGREPSDRRRVVGAALAGYLALNVAALLTAIEFGIQPGLFRAADGAPLYAPYGLDIAIPAMMLGHLAIAGPAEALITAFAVSYLLKTNPDLLRSAAIGGSIPTPSHQLRPLWVAIVGLVVAAPLGLLATGTAWGEWNPAEPENWPLPFVPEGLRALAGLWGAPIPDYTLPILGAGPEAQIAAYVLSAAGGVGILAALGGAISRLIGRSRRPTSP